MAYSIHGQTEFKISDISSHEFREIKLQHSLYISLSLIKMYLIGEDPVPHIIIHSFPFETLKAHIYLQYSICGLLSHSALESEGNKDLAEPDTSGSPAVYETQRYKNDKNIKQKERANYRDFSWLVSRRAACLVFCAIALSLTSSSS